ncbi:hypothetical protein CFK38_01315 [Brachybacterium vulturis]|uniref:Uncharacterized protein n=2 Tax=Brachybacterium vulturis TaxID=2017484 RepID=A0A291GJS7_9MICO|nr:hypothetical protein CFK38_01315 [Brachybacterium vulturis]
MGMSSLLERLLRSFEEFDIQVPHGTVAVALAVGEPASTYLIAAAPRHLGVDLSLRYSNTENGLIGFARRATQPYHLNTSTHHVECLDLESDEPATPGSVGRIVLTDLYNRATPFIRYDTGDLGRFVTDQRGTPIPNLLAELVGRRSDFPIAGTEQFPTRGNLYKLLMAIDSHPAIKQIQLRQNSIGRFKYILNAERSEELEAGLRFHLDEQIGNILECNFEYVSDVPLEPSGKRRFFFCEIPDPEGVLASGNRAAR